MRVSRITALGKLDVPGALILTVNVLQSTLLAELPWLIHGFGTRAAEQWPAEYTQVKQIHSNRIVVANGRHGCLDNADALVSSEPGNLIGIRTADCAPILIADPENRAVAAIHAGWRGTATGIAAGAVERLAQEFGSKPAQLLVAIGPAIGPCCFEVGPEVAELFQNDAVPSPNGKYIVNLPDAIFRQLVVAGVVPTRIDVMRLCTVCTGPGQFHSFRRDKEDSGRMVSAIGVSF
jgi:YfiH family protein